MKKVLVVDDEFLIRWSMQETLKDRFEVATAASVAEALRHIEQGRIDAIITDLRLPDGSGMELVEHLRAHQPWVKIFVVTAYGSDEIIDRLFALDVEAYLRKPFEMRLVRDMLEAHVNAASAA